MSMITVRTTDQQYRHIADGARAAGKSGQKFNLEALMAAASFVLQAQPTAVLPDEPPVPEGTIRLWDFEGAHHDVPRHESFPRSAIEAHQLQAGGQWYFEGENATTCAVMPDEQMRRILNNQAES